MEVKKKVFFQVLLLRIRAPDIPRNAWSREDLLRVEEDQEQYKSGPFSSLSHPLLSPPPPWNKVHLRPRDMSCYSQCLPCQPCGPTPLANSCNEPCVRQCQDSTIAIQPPAVVVTLPGPILSSFPQSTAVGSSTSAAVGSILSSEGVPISSGGFGFSGLGGSLCGRRCLPC
ncbi:feather keratin 1-like [Gymnogyps californianus]|uniref:feather keratin 1-like n=2 Tax=Gymnogyps californianus TaxID=33616 RepID=UPI0021C80B45|nr:feather keratin 1-like [Gymnogyps californianus]